jgi:hypothetical protein
MRGGTIAYMPPPWSTQRAARPWALWCTRIAQCFRTFGACDPHEHARGTMYSVLELLSAHVGKEQDGSPTGAITTSLHRATALLALLATEELRSGTAEACLDWTSVDNAEASFLLPLAHWIKSGSSLKGLTALFTKPRANMKIHLWRFQSIINNSVARSALLDIFPEILFLDMSEVAEGCCLDGDPHRETSPLYFLSKGIGLGPVLIIQLPEAPGTCIRLYTSSDCCTGVCSRPFEAIKFKVDDIVAHPLGTQRGRVRTCRIIRISGLNATTQACTTNGDTNSIKEVVVPLSTITPPSREVALKSCRNIEVPKGPALTIPDFFCYICWETDTGGPFWGYPQRRPQIFRTVH